MALCVWHPDSDGFKCSRCGAVRPTQVRRSCGSVPPGAPPPVCKYLGEFFTDDAGEPSRENVPCTSCGHKNGHKEYAVYECSSPENGSGECIPYYAPTDKNFVDYDAEGHRPLVCRRCPHFTPPA